MAPTLPNKKLRIVGDVHGKIAEYIEIVKDVDYSIQIGDMGFNYSALDALDPYRHWVFGGNHDNYLKRGDEFIYQPPHFLGDFGMIISGIFFVRGGLSIDKKWRTEGFDWFPDEELSYARSKECLDAYCSAKPMIVLSHECPQSIISMFTSFSDKETMDKFDCRLPSSTSMLLEQMYYHHQPELWIFGHYHIDREIKYQETIFRCLNELSHYDIFI